MRLEAWVGPTMAYFRSKNYFFATDISAYTGGLPPPQVGVEANLVSRQLPEALDTHMHTAHNTLLNLTSPPTPADSPRRKSASRQIW
jgi:hypothetical protein